MNYKDIAKKSDAELVELVREQREALRGARFSGSGMVGGDSGKIREARRMIAWALTEQSTRSKSSAPKEA